MSIRSSAIAHSRRAFRILASPRVSIWVLLTWLVLLVIWVLPFTLTGQSEETIGAIAMAWLPFRVVYWTLLVTTLACTGSRVVRDWRRCRSTRMARTHTQEGACVERMGLTATQVSRELEGRGFKTTGTQDGFTAVRGRYSPLWGSVFHIALLLLVGSFLLHEATLETAGMELIEGQSAAEFLAATPERDEMRVFEERVSTLRLMDVNPRFFKQYLLFERLDATAKYQGRDRRFSLARPLWLDATSFVSIQDFNYAPRVVVTTQWDEVLYDTASSLKLFPPGSQDTLRLPVAKLAIAMEVYPDHAVVDGKDVSLSYNLDDPKVQVTVFEMVSGTPRQRVLARGLLTPGESLTIPDGTRVGIDEILKVGTFRMVSAPALPVLLLAAALVSLSLAGRLLRPRADIVCTQTGDGVKLDLRIDARGPQMSRTSLELELKRMMGEGS